ncbi:MAG: glycosyltransferase [Deltaproteobacteria bacterium]|nr:glycosyltransferase [Deltaproteobacteria bacterium]
MVTQPIQARPLRIAYVIKEMVVGGSQTHLRQVLRLLDRERFAPVLVCLTGKGVLLDDVRAMGVPLVAPAAGLSFKGPALGMRILATARALRRLRVDIVHNYLLRANLVGSMAARLARVPVVLCSKRGCHERRGFELIGAKIGNALSDRVMVNADAVREFVHDNEGCAREKMLVIPSGVDTERFRPLPQGSYKTRLGLPEDRRLVGVVTRMRVRGVVTRMRVRKGVEEFVRAIALVRRDQPDVHGVIVGEVNLDDELQGLVHSLDLDDHLTLLGRRSDMPEVFSAFDLFVLSSHDEGMSNAILEAMAMEKPVVATDVGGTGEVVRHGHTGLLVPPKDPQALAVAIAEVMAQPERARAMGRLGRRVVEEGFSANWMVRQMEQVYLDLARRHGGAVTVTAHTTA